MLKYKVRRAEYIYIYAKILVFIKISISIKRLQQKFHHSAVEMKADLSEQIQPRDRHNASVMQTHGTVRQDHISGHSKPSSRCFGSYEATREKINKLYRFKEYRNTFI